ncbi:acyl-CoA dehydrogenase family protein [uncultured Sphingomonas sp.]|uniref:acyl-CoA dehydrogenase family protein n=1 Tax=uncultured Sphingomonas sp. TaxID=158754 RepID=UPI00263A16FC|nr:acyl-CoA dehydrogenase family protein [uncultured Sphingomonas sp.]
MSSAASAPRVQPFIPANDDFLTRGDLASLTPQELIRRTTALKPLLAAHAAECERARHPIESVWNEIRKTGCFYHFIPKKYGGLEFDADSFIDAMLPLSEGCPSTGWVTAFCVEHNWMLTQFPEQFQDEVFGTLDGDRVPYVIAPGATAPPGKAVKVDGGYRITGRWKWGTGVMHSDWVLVANMIVDGPANVVLFCALPTEQVTVLDTWHIDGMEGTGSHDLLIEDVFIPEHRTMDMAEMRAGTAHGSRLYDNPIYRQPMLPLLGVTAAISGVGAARAAVSLFREQLAERMVMGTNITQSEKPAAQMRLANASVMARTAELLLRDALNSNIALATPEKRADFEQRSRMRLQIAQAMELCRHAIMMVAEASGASSHLRSNPMQRYLRDVNVMSNHIVYDKDGAAELHGRSLIGLAPNAQTY